MNLVKTLNLSELNNTDIILLTTLVNDLSLVIFSDEFMDSLMILVSPLSLSRKVCTEIDSLMSLVIDLNLVYRSEFS
jgi:hypothetical protein